jgi:mannose-6-phosphate isomerase-like protein (cupin superfamily)
MFNRSFNPHYDFDAPENQAEIKRVDNYDIATDADNYRQGQIINSPWGRHHVTSVHHAGDQSLCTKIITIKPGYMLSLQRHRGRSEIWHVDAGVLTVIINGRCVKIKAGESIALERGDVHSMINSTQDIVIVSEVQKGVCREGDNIRLLDFNNRPIYPLTSEIELRSAKLYARIQAGHVKQYGFKALPSTALLNDNESS